MENLKKYINAVNSLLGHLCKGEFASACLRKKAEKYGCTSCLEMYKVIDQITTLERKIKNDKIYEIHNLGEK